MVSLAEISFQGHGLNRPECVLAHQSGLLIASDWSGMGGVSIISPSGKVHRHLALNAPRPLHPNGIALEKDGSILLAELSDDTGGVWRLHPDGTVEPVLVDIDGVAVPPTNFVLPGNDNDLFVTVSTRRSPRHLGARADRADGFIIWIKNGYPRIVADALGFANECIIDREGRYLYVNETFARRLTRFTLQEHSLEDRQVIATFGAGTYPDGLTFDAEGHLWITSIVSNRVIRVSPQGDQTIFLEDADPDHMAYVEKAYLANRIERRHLDTMKSRKLKAISSLAFGGPDLRTAFLGCLQGGEIASFVSPVPGLEPRHFSYPIEALQRRLVELSVDD